MTSKSILTYKAISPTNLKKKKNNRVWKTNLWFWLHRVYFYFSTSNKKNGYWFLNLHKHQFVSKRTMTIPVLWTEITDPIFPAPPSWSSHSQSVPKEAYEKQRHTIVSFSFYLAFGCFLTSYLANPLCVLIFICFVK